MNSYPLQIISIVFLHPNNLEILPNISHAYFLHLIFFSLLSFLFFYVFVYFSLLFLNLGDKSVMTDAQCR